MTLFEAYISILIISMISPIFSDRIYEAYEGLTDFLDFWSLVLNSILWPIILIWISIEFLSEFMYRHRYNHRRNK